MSHSAAHSALKISAWASRQAGERLAAAASAYAVRPRQYRRAPSGAASRHLPSRCLTSLSSPLASLRPAVILPQTVAIASPQTACSDPTPTTHSSTPIASQPEAKSTLRWQHPDKVVVQGREYSVDDWFNVPNGVLQATSRRLHLQPNHPLCLTRQLIEAHFPAPIFQHHADLHPVVTTAQNFDTLDFPADHSGRSRSETYYLDRSTLLRTHTSAHQVELFSTSSSSCPGFTLSADVYRRDAIDRSHYPVFHQMEGALTWERVPAAPPVADSIWRDLAALPDPGLAGGVDLPYDPVSNPRQAASHTEDEVRAVAAHLKRSLEVMVVAVFAKARQLAAIATATISPSCPTDLQQSPLQIRWVEAYFPFTSPSWELEVLHEGQWLEVLGCGVVRQNLLDRAGRSRLGWAFGLGLDRIAMLLLGIPDIRLFWSRDSRFLSQFADGPTRFTPFSTHPPCYKDVSFWLPETGPPHANDVMELVRAVAADLVEDVRLLEEFVHSVSGRRSMCYRITYRSLERTMTNAEVVGLQTQVCARLQQQLRVEIR